MPSIDDRRVATALLILRFFLALFLILWGIDKLILPEAPIRIAQNFYGVTLPTAAPYLLGIGELLIALQSVLGAALQAGSP